MELQLCTFSLPRLLAKPFKIMQTKFLLFVRKEIENVKRLDIVWDRYVENSLKDDSRESRGQGIRKRVISTSLIPSNWHSFLRSNENKAELFLFLAHQIKDINIKGEANH